MAGEQTVETPTGPWYRVSGAYGGVDLCIEKLRETAAFIPPCSILRIGPVGFGAGTLGFRVEVKRDLFGSGVNLLRLGAGYSTYQSATSDKPTREWSLRIGEEISWKIPSIKWPPLKWLPIPDSVHSSEIQPTFRISHDGETFLGLNVQVKEGLQTYLPGVGGLNIFILDQSVPLFGRSPIQFQIGAELFCEKQRSHGRRVASLLSAALLRTVPMYRLADASQHVSNVPGVATADFKWPFPPIPFPHAFETGVNVMNGILNMLPGTIYYQRAIDGMPARESLVATIPTTISGAVLGAAGYGSDDIAIFTVGNYLLTNGLAAFPKAWWPEKDEAWKRSLWGVGIAALQLSAGALLVSQGHATQPVGYDQNNPGGNPFNQVNRGRNPAPYGFSMLGQGGALAVVELSGILF